MAVLWHPFASPGLSGPPEAATDKSKSIPFAGLSDGTYLFQGEDPPDERALMQSPSFQAWLGAPPQQPDAVQAALDPVSDSSSSSRKFNNSPHRLDPELIKQADLDEMRWWWGKILAGPSFADIIALFGNK